MIKTIITHRLVVPAIIGEPGDGTVITQQLDVVLMQVGFKLSSELAQHLMKLHPVVVKTYTAEILAAVQELVGDHVRHNSYFLGFPANVPDTKEFWLQCIVDALADPRSAAPIMMQLAGGSVNLLDLPKYGRYQHSFEDLVEAHAPLIAGAKDRVTVLGLGGSLREETHQLYLSMAESDIPLSPDKQLVLKELAELCVDDAQPEQVPVREHRALINAVRVGVSNQLALIVDSTTDILRLACALSDGDVSLVQPTVFTSFTRATRRQLMKELNTIVQGAPGKLADVARFRERWKRLGERLHPHEFTQYPHAQDVFKVARGEKMVRSFGGRVEVAFLGGNVKEAATILAERPGAFVRNLDRLLVAAGADDARAIVDHFVSVKDKVSARVLLSVFEHLRNRVVPTGLRVFPNARGTSWTQADDRSPLTPPEVSIVNDQIATEMAVRLKPAMSVLVDPEILSVAVPLSQKQQAGGFGILPRGSTAQVGGQVRFFTYWKERSWCTDFDLSMLVLDEAFQAVDQVSWTNLLSIGAVHSGDITESPNGASEFIEVDLNRVRGVHAVPQINIYSGERFTEVEESFFGYMERGPEQAGLPFEPQTVRMKSDVRGRGRVALPLLFSCKQDGTWMVKWLHMHLNGSPNFNTVERNHHSTAALMSGLYHREYLTINDLVGWMVEGASAPDTVTFYEEGMELPKSPVLFIGFSAPAGLAEGSKVVTPLNLHELIPA